MIGTFKIGGPAFANRNRGVEQEIILSVARMSNFNVLLQSRHLASGGMDCRAYCKECQQFKVLEFDKLVVSQIEKDVWVELGIFCEEHRHDGPAKEQRMGRRIREEV